jgi:hypothetical protein
MQICNSEYMNVKPITFFKIALLRILDVYPGSRILIFNLSMIPDLKTATKKSGEKKFVVNLFCSHKCHKILNYFIFGMLKKNLGQFSKNYRTFYKKFVTNLSKIRGRDPGSEIQDSRSGIGKKLFRIPDPGLGVKRPRIRIHNNVKKKVSSFTSRQWGSS